MKSAASTKRLRQKLVKLAGFSLIEILVVMAIIAFLTAAIVVIIPRVANTAKVAATRATIKKVDELLNDRINGFSRWIQTQNRLAGLNPPGYVQSSSYVSQYVSNRPLYQILAAKVAFRAAFPQSFAEMTTPPSYDTSKHKQATESAACLYLILTQASVFDTEPPAASDLKAVEVADTDGDGLMEVVDAWGCPLRFYRWPTRLIRPATSGAAITTAGWNAFSPAPAPTPATILIRSAPRLPLASWKANTVYLAGQIIQPATLPSGDVMMYQCTCSGASGTSSGSEPNWSSALLQGQSTPSDGNIVWQATLDSLGIDSDDPNGLASSNLVNESVFHTWSTYHVTLILSSGGSSSSGADAALAGLYEPYDTAHFGNLAQPQLDGSGNPLLDALYPYITNHQQ